MKAEINNLSIGIEKFIDISTHRLRVVLSELPSEHTIVLEAGGGKDADSYKAIQSKLANLIRMRVMSYDRSGFGLSELGPAHFNAVDEVKALKRCLEIQGFADKLILVGLSYGGFLIQLFTALYPELVSGLVLIDPMNVSYVDHIGLEKLNAMMPYFENPATNPEKAGNRMIDFSSESFAALCGKELPQHIPVILLTSGIPPLPGRWRQCHEEMVMNSEMHQLLIAEENHHDIVEENPELVIQTIIELTRHIS